MGLILYVCLYIVHRFISAQRGLCLSLRFSMLKSALRLCGGGLRSRDIDLRLQKL
jgi:hypothetical protein